MYDETMNERVSGFLRYRAMEDFGIRDMTQAELAELLTKECRLAPRAARQLAEGRDDTLISAPDLQRVADTFQLSGELLACLLNPPSAEVLAHVITAAADGHLNSDECPICMELEERVEQLSSADPYEEAQELCFDLLDHLVYPDDVDTDDGALHDEDLFDEDAATAAVSADPLWDAVSQLDRDARRRVLAYAYQELARTTDGTHAAAFAAYAHLRSSEQLPAVARRTIDLLAQAPAGMMSGQDLVRALDLADTRCLRELPTAVSAAVAALADDGVSVPDCPVSVSGNGAKLRLQMTAASRVAWRALISADRA